MHSLDEAVAIVEAFLAEPFSQDDRHQKRIDQVMRFERDGVLPPLPG
jgi:ribose 5-phosphate isomerase B